MKFKQFCHMMTFEGIKRFMSSLFYPEVNLSKANQLRRIEVCCDQLKNQVKYPEICDYGYLSLEFYRSMNSKMKFLVISKIPLPFRKAKTPLLVDKLLIPQEIPHLPSFSRRSALENFSFISKYGTEESILNIIFIAPLIRLKLLLKFKLITNTVGVCCIQIVNEIRYPEICDYGYFSERYHLIRYNKLITRCNRLYANNYYNFCKLVKTLNSDTNVFLANSIYGATGLGHFLLSNKYEYNTIITIKEKKRYASIENK